jgi:hypothetical protein
LPVDLVSLLRIQNGGYVSDESVLVRLLGLRAGRTTTWL